MNDTPYCPPGLSNPAKDLERKPNPPRKALEFQPILDRILVRKIEAVTEKNGITIPDKYQESNEYEVVALGDFALLGNELLPLNQFLSVGNIVLLSPYNVERVEIEGEEFWLSRIQDVRGKKRGNRPSATAAVPA